MSDEDIIGNIFGLFNELVIDKTSDSILEHIVTNNVYEINLNNNKYKTGVITSEMFHKVWGSMSTYRKNQIRKLFVNSEFYKIEKAIAIFLFYHVFGYKKSNITHLYDKEPLTINGMVFKHSIIIDNENPFY